MPLSGKNVSLPDPLYQETEYVAKSSGDETLGARHVGLGLGVDRMQGAHQ